MTRLETRIAALHDVALRLFSALSLAQLEEIRQSVLSGPGSPDPESQLMRTEFLTLLDDAIERGRLAEAASDSIHHA